jgi:transposase
MKRDELDRLTKEQLIELILAQFEQLKQLAQVQVDLAQLKADNEALKMKIEYNRKPPSNSKNSSQPPSRDQKENQPQGRHKHRHGPPEGHEKHERKFTAQPDHIIPVRAKCCQHCHSELADEGRLVKVNQITELPKAKAEVIEVRQYETICACCGQAQVEEPPVGLAMERTFGARLEATVVYYRQEQHMSYERTQLALLNLHGVEISQGGIDGIMQRAGEKAIQAVKPIAETVRQSAVIHSDETTSRVGGNTWWEWVFCSAKAVLHVIRFNRSEDVIKDVMEKVKAEVWESDCYGAQLKAPAKQLQLCLAHQVRNLQAVVDLDPTLTWPRAMQVLFRYSIHLHHQRNLLSPDQFAAQVARVERHCDRLLQRNLDPPDARRLQRRYLKHRQKLFVFLYRTDVDPTNNVAERALRPSVIHRKVTGCFRSKWGAEAYAALASVIDTAELSGVHAFVAIQSLFGSPSLPLLVGGE